MKVKGFTFNGFQENTYIIEGQNNECILIDPGMYTTEEKKWFVDYIQNNDLKPILLLNTHCHLDHVFGIAHVLHTFTIPFCFHEKEMPVFESAHRVGEVYGMPFDKLPAPTYFISEKETINLNDEKLQVLFTPGHSPGSISLYSADYSFVISGDVLFKQSIGRTDLPGGNTDTIVQSIHTQLFTLPDNTVVYSGHGEPTTIGFEKRNNPFVRLY